MAFEIRDRSVVQGRRPLSEEREEYFRLVDLGYSNKAACRIVGINVRTGRRWRYGNSATGRHVEVRPVTAAPRPSVRGRYLNEAERLHIADRVREKASLRTIARELDRSPSTISREIRRNRHPGNGQYRPHAAQARADSRRPRPKPGKIGQNLRLRDYIHQRLELRWSPEQIVHHLRRDIPR